MDHRDREALGALDPQTGEGVGVARYVRLDGRSRRRRSSRSRSPTTGRAAGSAGSCSASSSRPRARTGCSGCRATCSPRTTACSSSAAPSGRDAHLGRRARRRRPARRGALSGGRRGRGLGAPARAAHAACGARAGHAAPRRHARRARHARRRSTAARTTRWSARSPAPWGRPVARRARARRAIARQDRCTSTGLDEQAVRERLSGRVSAAGAPVRRTPIRRSASCASPVTSSSVRASLLEEDLDERAVGSADARVGVRAPRARRSSARRRRRSACRRARRARGGRSGSRRRRRATAGMTRPVAARRIAPMSIASPGRGGPQAQW